MEDYKYLFKIVLIGNAGVGKTCLVRRFTQGLFPPGQGATIGVDFMIKTLQIGGDRVKLQVWDTAGQERFRSITQSYYHSADALVMVYDVTSRESYNALPEWMKEVETYASPKIITVLVGNKTDLVSEREVKSEEGQVFADEKRIQFLETSAKEAENVDKLFIDIAVELTNTVRNVEIKTDSEEVPIKEHHSVTGCCR
ncbi:ras-related protein Rab-30-like [Anneissia japonica]|uniref:ras-related protein Rab-30-like n=1 Tax=Anneissia japonica TaxID=1529436 RepID=UPI00142588D6|nr:ras-related protein Rab-30-like [Anneissia japonica]XP_033127119.1 ras-related protein Rab-30-like [Anneissia japonica]